MASVAESEIAPASPAGLTILLVEDNPHVLTFAEHLLSELHYKVVSANCGEEALEKLDKEKIDLLLTDVVMPGMSGIELARLVRERFPHMPVVLASGYSEEILEGSGAEFEMLRKPFNAASVNGAIGSSLRAVRSMKETLPES